MSPQPKKQPDEPTAGGWRPEPGDEIAGVLVDMQLGTTWDGDGSYPILTLRKEDGDETDLHCFHEVLRKRVMTLRPQSGETVRAKFHGQRPSKDGKRTVTLYTLTVDGRDGVQSAWDELDRQNQTAAPPKPDQAGNTAGTPPRQGDIDPETGDPIPF